MKISAVIPVYNGEKFIAECIESLIPQTKKFDEMLLGDNGNTSNTMEIAKKYPITLIENPHFGRLKTRNTIPALVKLFFYIFLGIIIFKSASFFGFMMYGWNK